MGDEDTGAKGQGTEDQISQGGTPTDDDGKGIPLDQIREILSPFGEQLQVLGDAFQTLKQEVTELKQGTKPEGQDTKTPDWDDHELESLSRKEFLGRIEDRIISKIKEELVQPISQRLDSDKEEEIEREIREQLKQAEAQHPDFWEWKQEMADEVRKNPYLTPEDAYQLARIKNSQKADELDKKHKLGKYKDENPDATKKKPVFGGLTPTSSTSDEESGRMKPKEAAERAYAEIFGE